MKKASPEALIGDIVESTSRGGIWTDILMTNGDRLILHDSPGWGNAACALLAGKKKKDANPLP